MKITLQPVIDEMEMDINQYYDDNRKRSIELAAIVAFSATLIGEFVKGFFDFERLGLTTRQMFNRLFGAEQSEKPKTSSEYETELTVLMEHIIHNDNLRQKKAKRKLL